MIIIRKTLNHELEAVRDSCVPLANVTLVPLIASDVTVDQVGFVDRAVRITGNR